MQRKIVLSVILIALLLTTIAGCGSSDKTANNYGKIEATGEATVAKDPNDIFTQLKEPLGYEYSSYQTGKGKFSITYPSKWILKEESDDHAIIYSADDDKLLHNVTIHIVTNHNASYDTASANAAIDFFKGIVNTLEFRIDQEPYLKVDYDTPDEYTTNEKIIKNAPDTLMITTDNDLNLTDKYMNKPSIKGAYVGRAYYINWQGGTPYLIYFVGESKEKKNLIALADYMVSTMKYYKEPISIAASKEITPLDDSFHTVFDLPKDWERTKACSKGPFDSIEQYRASSLSSVYSGMVATIYSGDRKTLLPKINSDAIKESLSDTLSVNYFTGMQKSYFNNAYTFSDIGKGSLGGKPAAIYNCRTIIRKTIGSPDNVPDAIVMNSLLIVLYNDETVNLIDVAYQDDQAATMKKVSDLISSTVVTK